MSSRRSLSWSAAIREMRADRAPVPILVTVADRTAHHAGVRAATERFKAASRSLVLARLKPLSVAGRFDRAAIMRLAVAAAREKQALAPNAPPSWQVAMAAGLTMAWAHASAARRAIAH